jgi:nucleoside-diphosphate kinase
MIEQTLVIVKPDAVTRGLTGEILSRFEKAGLRILGMKMMSLSEKDFEKFYAEHEGKPFFEGLTQYMSSGPIVPAVISGENAVARAREIMGATNPADAAEGTIRKDFGLELPKNTIHGSDSPTSATREISFFFNALELNDHTQNT